MGEARALRVLLVANDGFSVGHVTRTIAIARALERRARARDLTVRMLLATTSEADALLARESFAMVRLPAPLAARRAGFSDSERRRLVRGVLEGTFAAFGPDLLVCDTFPSGPHGELASLPKGNVRRALVRRSVRGDSEALTAGIDDYDLAILTDDPVATGAGLSIPTLRVPPITLGEASAGRDRATARRELGLPNAGPVMLVAAGGGGDPAALAQANDVARTLVRLCPDATVVRAIGPLEEPQVGSELHQIRVAPLQPFLSAFDAAFSPAGYNTAHELAKAGVPAVLFAQSRPFDDQAARAMRFAEHGLAYALERFDDESVMAALAWTKSTTIRSLESGGADRAADALLDLVTRPRGEVP